VVGIDGRMVYESLVLPENEIIGMYHLILLFSKIISTMLPILSKKFRPDPHKKPHRKIKPQ
jgi:hypothetical protein